MARMTAQPLHTERSGIFPGIFSLVDHPSAAAVIDKLGQDFVDAFFVCVYGAQDDLESLIHYQPGWASTYTQRFKANFLHERIWARLLPTVKSSARFDVRDREPFRTLNVGTELYIRIKRHSEDDQISTYRTAGALDFYGVDAQETLDGMQTLGLALGYRWDREIDKVLAPVISLQDLKNSKILWSVELFTNQSVEDNKVDFWELNEPPRPGISITEQLQFDLGVDQKGGSKS